MAVSTSGNVPFVVDPFRSSGILGSRLFRHAHLAAIVFGILALVLATVPPLDDSYRLELVPVMAAAYAFFTFELFTRGAISLRAVRILPHPRARLRRLLSLWVGSYWGLIDVLAVVLPLVLILDGLDLSVFAVAAVAWSLKLPRHVTGLAMLGRVIVRERDALVSVLAAFGILLLTAATLAYLAERDVQPKVFGNVPEALWWAITTITTTGYGDTVPSTVAGKLLAGVVMICGLGVFALWAGILATGFSAELRRRDFLRTWDLVAEVPMFQSSGSGLIAEAAALLRPRSLPANALVTTRGSPGDSMFFIVEGEVELALSPRPIRLRSGAFFGEIALITGEPRSVDIRTTHATTLLVLDIADFRGLAARYPELAATIHTEAQRRISMNEEHRQAEEE